MKRYPKVLAAVTAVFALCTALALTACGSSGSTGAEPGTYSLYELQSPTEPVTHETVQMMEAFGLTASLVLNEDGTGSLVLFGAPVDITWDAKGISYQGSKVSYEYEDGTIILSTGEEKMIFKRVESAPGQ
ncbi:MAG: hypothetical protein IKD70_10535 [Eggerthellaceae bacterium]|nr:hypothetical protein [Eggerthellaceae bacterium]